MHSLILTPMGPSADGALRPHVAVEKRVFHQQFGPLALDVILSACRPSAHRPRSYSSSVRRGSARRPLLSPAENKGFAVRSGETAMETNGSRVAAPVAPVEVTTRVEIKCRAPHAIFMILAP